MNIILLIQWMIIIIAGEFVMEKVLFSELALGTKFKYKENDIEVYVKIGVELDKGCIALWKEEEKVSNWVCQPVYSFNDSNKDEKVFVL